MTRDQNKFISLKKGKTGSVAFGNDSSVNILRKGVVILGSEKVKETNVLLVEDLKQNLLSVRKCVIEDAFSHLIPENVKLEKHIQEY